MGPCSPSSPAGAGRELGSLRRQQLQICWHTSIAEKNNKKNVSVKTCSAKRASLAQGPGLGCSPRATVPAPCQAGRHGQGAGLAAGISPGGCAAPTGDGEQGTWLSHRLPAFAGAQRPPSSNGGGRARTRQRAAIPRAFLPALLPPPAWCPQSPSPWGLRGGQEAPHAGMSLVRVVPAPSPCCSVGLGASPARRAAQGAGCDSSWDFSLQVGDLLPVPSLGPDIFSPAMLPHKVLSGSLFPHPCFCAPIPPTPGPGFILMTSGRASPSSPEGSVNSCHRLGQQLATAAASLLPEPSAPLCPTLRDTRRLLARGASCRE